MTGLFITFEGVEGAGKSTQIVLLRDALAAQGYPVFVTREPGGHPVAEAIRGVLLAAAEPVTPAAELLLFLAARAELTERVLRPRLAAGEIVLCDRYIDSTVAYQGYARGHDIDMVRQLNAFATSGLTPDITILLDIDPEKGLARQSERNRMEAESLEFHRRVRAGYLAEAEREPDRIRIVNADRSVEEIHADIFAIVRKTVGSRKGAKTRKTGKVTREKSCQTSEVSLWPISDS
jgi:dTMP kinase